MRQRWVRIIPLKLVYDKVEYATRGLMKAGNEKRIAAENALQMLGSVEDITKCRYLTENMRLTLYNMGNQNLEEILESLKEYEVTEEQIENMQNLGYLPSEILYIVENLQNEQEREFVNHIMDGDYEAAFAMNPRFFTAAFGDYTMLEGGADYTVPETSIISTFLADYSRRLYESSINWENPKESNFVKLERFANAILSSHEIVPNEWGYPTTGIDYASAYLDIIKEGIEQELILTKGMALNSEGADYNYYYKKSESYDYTLGLWNSIRNIYAETRMYWELPYGADYPYATYFKIEDLKAYLTTEGKYIGMTYDICCDKYDPMENQLKEIYYNIKILKNNSSIYELVKNEQRLREQLDAINNYWGNQLASYGFGEAKGYSLSKFPGLLGNTIGFAIDGLEMYLGYYDAVEGRKASEEETRSEMVAGGIVYEVNGDKYFSHVFPSIESIQVSMLWEQYGINALLDNGITDERLDAICEKYEKEYLEEESEEDEENKMDGEEKCELLRAILYGEQGRRIREEDGGEGFNIVTSEADMQTVANILSDIEIELEGDISIEASFFEKTKKYGLVE